MKAFLRSATVAVLLFGGAGAALAHDTGQERRTPEQCASLPTGRRGGGGMQAACMKCISRVTRRGMHHHFHPENPPHNRCRKDNGRP